MTFLKLWVSSFRLKGKNTTPLFLIQVEGWPAIFSAKSKMADLCSFWPRVSCQGSDINRLK